MTNADKHQRTTSHTGPHEENETPARERPGTPGPDEPGSHPDEDQTAGSEGGGRTVGLGGYKEPKHGSPARPLRDGH